jgi:hypothetical protein
VGVAVEASLGVAVRGLVASEIPDDESLVATSRQEHVRAGQQLAYCRDCSYRSLANVLLQRGSEGGNPARVALEGATENQLLGHDEDGWLKLSGEAGTARGIFRG